MDPKNIFSPIFLNNDNALSYLIENNYISITKQCIKCQKTTNIVKCSRSKVGWAYICPNMRCKKVMYIKILKESSIKIELCFLLRAVYCFTLNYDNNQAVSACEISAPSYIKIKKEILKKIATYNKTNVKIGGEGIEVQLDETAICNGRIITDPSNTLDETAGVQWIVGGVEKNNSRKLFLVLVPNRRQETLFDVFKKFIKPGSLLVTDGYPSYPGAVREFGSVHVVVNHSLGFKNEEGFTTNNIENVWSHFKTMYRSRHGLCHNLIPTFVEEFVFRKKNLRLKNNEQYCVVFTLLLNLLINN